MRLSASDIFDAAKANGKSPAWVALQNGITPDYNMWPEVTRDLDNSREVFNDFDLTELAGAKGKFITRYAKAIAESVQFPPSTVFMHMLGCLSTAMIHRFTLAYSGFDVHPGLYIVSAQPPSTGKSGVNGLVKSQIGIAFEAVNKRNRMERARIQKRIDDLNKQRDQAGNTISENELIGIQESIANAFERLKEHPIYRYDMSDATPEAVAKVAESSNGCFFLVSDEATIINTSLGLSYGSEGKMVNNEAILKGWDGGRVAIVRVGRDSEPFDAKGAISVIAQSETIRSILLAGERGNGLTERFMFINEPNLLGQRQYIDDNGNELYRPVPQDMIATYSRMVHGLVLGDKVEMTMTAEARSIIAMHKQAIEPKLGDSGEFSGPLLRGVMGKMDKQVCKLATVLHCAEEWANGGASTVIQAETVKWAIDLFTKLSATFISAAQAEGYAGKDAEAEKMLDKIIKMSGKKNSVSISKVYQAIRNVIPFKGSENLRWKMDKWILPDMEKSNMIVVVGKEIFVNPRLL